MELMYPAMKIIINSSIQCIVIKRKSKQGTCCRQDGTSRTYRAPAFDRKDLEKPFKIEQKF